MRQARRQDPAHSERPRCTGAAPRSVSWQTGVIVRTSTGAEAVSAAGISLNRTLSPNCPPSPNSPQSHGSPFLPMSEMNTPIVARDGSKRRHLNGLLRRNGGRPREPAPGVLGFPKGIAFERLANPMSTFLPRKAFRFAINTDSLLSHPANRIKSLFHNPIPRKAFESRVCHIPVLCSPHGTAGFAPR